MLGGNPQPSGSQGAAGDDDSAVVITENGHAVAAVGVEPGQPDPSRW